MKPINLKLPVRATWEHDCGEEHTEDYNLFLEKDLRELANTSGDYYLREMVLPEGSLSKILSYFHTGDHIRETKGFLPMPGTKDEKWKRLGTPPIADLSDAFPGMEIREVNRWVTTPPKSTGKKVGRSVAPDGYEVSIYRELWDSGIYVDRLRIRTRRKNRPLPIRKVKEIASLFLGDRIFWFDIERTNLSEASSPDFHRYHFLSLAEESFTLTDLIEHGAAFLILLRTLATKKEESATFKTL
jgi:hypothetical protein